MIIKPAEKKARKSSQHRNNETVASEWTDGIDENCGIVCCFFYAVPSLIIKIIITII